MPNNVKPRPDKRQEREREEKTKRPRAYQRAKQKCIRIFRESEKQRALSSTSATAPLIVGFAAH